MSTSLQPTWLAARSDDATPLRLARWGNGDRDVLLVHGLAEHAGRYNHVATALVEAGWRVTLVELRGHGKSGGRRGHCGAWHRYVEDVQAAAGAIGRPFAILAHSMGGLVSLDALREPLTPPCRALALSNPLLGLAFEAPAWKVKMSTGLSRLLPWLPVPSGLDTAFLSHDAEVVRAYEADPMVFSSVTPRWFTESQAAMARVNGDPGRTQLPLRLMVSTGDKICDHKVALRLYEGWTADKTLAVYDDLYHEIFNEPQKDAILADLVAWLDKVWAPTT